MHTAPAGRVPQYRGRRESGIYFGGEILEDGSTVHGCCGSYAPMAGCAGLQVPVDTSHWELTTKRCHDREQRCSPPSGGGGVQVTPRLTCSPALWERDTAFAFALPLSFPALPPACVEQKPVYAQLCWEDNKEGSVHARQLKLTAHGEPWRDIAKGCGKKTQN